MRTTLALVVGALFLVGAPAAVVLADAIPGCPAGQHVVMNPVPPGAMHHGGGHCEPNTSPPTKRRTRRTTQTTTHPTPPPPAPPSAPPSGGSRS